MDKQIEVLHTIFEFELAPPFTFQKESNEFMEMVAIYNRFSTNIGFYYEDSLNFYPEVEESFVRKIKSTFNVDKISKEDTDNIAKHLVKWWQKNVSVNVKYYEIWNEDEGTYGAYNSN